MSINIDRALVSPRMLGAGLGDTVSWQTWLAVLRAAFGLPLDEQQQTTFASVAGDRTPPTQRVRELWCVCGRRAGKSRIAAALAVYVSLFTTHKLAAGERGECLVLAASIPQSRTVFQYIKGFLDAAPALAREVESVTANEVVLRNGITIGVHASSFRTVRGRSLICAIFDEVSFWRDETSAMPDAEVYTAVLPALATTNGMLIGISTPYRKQGLLYQKHKDYFGIADNDVLVVQGTSKAFNPSLSDGVIATQRAADPASAMSEWDAEFRTDIGALLDDASIEGAVEVGRPLELPPRPGYRSYWCFVDAAGGVGADSYTIAIGHKEREKDQEFFVIDLVRGTSGKFDPQTVTGEYAALLKQYNVRSVTGDNYAAEWVGGAWAKCHVSYSRSELPKSAIYLECVPLFTRGLVRLPDHPRLLRELRLLERRTHRSGRDTVDHPRNGRDDHANAVCGVLRALSDGLSAYNNYAAWVGGGAQPGNEAAEWQRLRMQAYVLSGGRARP